MARPSLLPLLLASSLASSLASPRASAHGHPKVEKKARAEVKGPAAGASSVPTPVFTKDGTLFVAFVEGQHVWVAASKDLGTTFGKAVAVNPDPEAIEDNGEGRPKIAFGIQGDVYVAYNQNLAKPYTGHIRFSRSTDGGATFAVPITVDDDGVMRGHQFEALAVSGSGDVTLVWVDKRDREAAVARGETYPGGALYAATSTDSGKTFGKNLKVADSICECCRIASDVDAKGDPVFLFRDIFLEGGKQIRDHALVRFQRGKPGLVTRASFDGWAVDGCPHHGPALSFAPDGRAHLTWFTGDGTRGRGLFYASTNDGGKTFTESMPLGTPGRSVYPNVLASGSSVVVVWLESDAGVTKAMLRRSGDGGKSFGPAKDLLATTSTFDHPLLVRDRDRVLLSWFTDAEGLRLVETK